MKKKIYIYHGVYVINRKKITLGFNYSKFTHAFQAVGVYWYKLLSTISR